MNLLPKKSWHVGTKKNIERVHRDEAEAERLAIIEQDRILRAEQEARIRELRSRAGISEPENHSHVNLFEESKNNQQSDNKDYIEEKRKEETDWQQKVGILKKLVRSEDVNAPWYCNNRPNDQQPGSSHHTSESNSKRPRRSDLISSIYDPMTAIKDAERIVRLKRAEQKKLERLSQSNAKVANNHLDFDYHRNVPPPLNSAKFMITASKGRPQLAQIVESDSSPEIVKIINNHNTSRIRGRKDEKRKSKKHKKHHHKHKSHNHHHKHKRHKR